MRKDAGLSVTQRVELGLETESADLRQAIREYRDYIMDEVLVTRLEESAIEDSMVEQEFKIEGERVRATMRW
jgi:hypothetical protein